MKKPDLLILIAIWEFITAFMAFIGIAVIAIITFVVDYTVRNGWGYYNGMWGSGVMPRACFIIVISVVIFILLCYMAFAIVSGIGLLRGKEWGRITAIVHSGLSLCSFPIGTVIGVMSIIYLTKQEVKEYFVPPPKA